jgi:IS30 family transposase
MMKRSKSTIREGNTMADIPKIAQDRSRKRRNESNKHSKWKNIKLLHFIERRLKKKWSPEIISMEWKRSTGETFSHKSIYTIIEKHRPEWKKLLVHTEKRKKQKASAREIQNRVSIEKRPKIVDSRKRFGDWEVDTVPRLKIKVQEKCWLQP